MLYLGLDIASATGWSLFEDQSLLEVGTIQLVPGMDLPQKLHYFHLELKRLVERTEPHWCFVEDVFLGISGAKTLAFLSRLNGVAINTVFSILQERVKLYQPDYWKAHSIDGLNGHAQKWEIQMAVIQKLDISVTGNFDSIKEQVKNFYNLIETKKKENIKTREIINKKKSQLKLKRKPLSEDMKLSVKCRVKELEKISLSLKQDIKDEQKTFNKLMDRTSIDIAAQTGMTHNICDACGIAMCGYKDLINDTD